MHPGRLPPIESRLSKIFRSLQGAATDWERHPIGNAIVVMALAVKQRVIAFPLE